MSRPDNYPDDIRMYDSDPRSPFFDDTADDPDQEDDGGYGDWIYEQMKDRQFEARMEAEEQYQLEQDKRHED